MALFSRRWSARNLMRLDIVAAVGFVVVCAYAASESPPGGPAEPGWVTWLVAVALGAPVAVRRRWPFAVFVIVAVVSVTALGSGVIPPYAATAPVLPVAYAVYIFAATDPGSRSATATLLYLSALAGAIALFGHVDFPEAAGGFLYLTLIVALSRSAGFIARERRAFAARSAAAATREAVTDERLRIARELHDIVAHSMSLITVKAAIANHVADERPQEVRDVLRVIEATSRAALDEMRRAVGALRVDGDTPVELGPAPRLVDLPELVERAAAAGVRVELDVSGVEDLPPGVELSVYRIVQESLTNVVQHAGPVRCRAKVAVVDGEVRVDVTNDAPTDVSGTRPEGRRHDGVRDGQGLLGMRERVSMYGGTVTAQPRAGGGFAVSARLPLRSAK